MMRKLALCGLVVIISACQQPADPQQQNSSSQTSRSADPQSAPATNALHSGDWALLSEQSQLHFISTKNGNLAEVHRFSTLSGAVLAAGQFELLIDLNGVDTAIAVRDQRMRDELFRTSEYPQAVARGQFDSARVAQLMVDETWSTELQLELLVNGRTLPMQLPVTVNRLGEQRLQVISAKPIVLQAEALGLTAGVERLRELAGLQAISLAVPVTFRLVFEPME